MAHADAGHSDNRLRAVLPAAETGKNWRYPASWQPRAKAPTTPSSSRCNSFFAPVHRSGTDTTQLTALAGPWSKLRAATASVALGKGQQRPAIGEPRLRTRDRAAMGFLVTITSSRHSGIAQQPQHCTPTCPYPRGSLRSKFCFIVEDLCLDR